MNASCVDQGATWAVVWDAEINPSRNPTATLTVSLSRRKLHAEIGIAFSQSPLWGAEIAVSLATLSLSPKLDQSSALSA